METTLTNKQDVEATVAVTVPAKDVDAAFAGYRARRGRNPAYHREPTKTQITASEYVVNTRGDLLRPRRLCS